MPILIGIAPSNNVRYNNCKFKNKGVIMKECIILDLLLIKARIHMLNHRISKAVNTKLISDLRDKKLELRRDFAYIIYDNYEFIASLIERISQKSTNTFNVMAMIGGPYYIRKEATLHAYKAGFGSIQVIFDSYIGVLNLLDDPCGIDNLKILSDNFFN